MRVPFLNFEGGPGVSLLNFRGSWIPLLNLEGDSGSGVPGPRVLRSRVLGSWPHFYTMPEKLHVESYKYKYTSNLNETMKLVTPMISINIFFRKDCDQSIQYSRSTNLTSHASWTLLSTDLSLFLEKLMLVFIFLLIYFTIQHLEYIQDEVRHTVRVQQVSIFVIQPVSLLASSSLRALRK